MRVYFAFAFMALLWQLFCVGDCARKKKTKPTLTTLDKAIKALKGAGTKNNAAVMKALDYVQKLGETSAVLSNYKCDSNAECKKVSNNSQCTERGTCECIPGYATTDENKIECVVSNIADIDCTGKNPCKEPNTKCNTKTKKCECKKGHSNRKSANLCQQGPCEEKNMSGDGDRYPCDQFGYYEPLQKRNTTWYSCMTTDGIWLDPYGVHVYNETFKCKCAIEEEKARQEQIKSMASIYNKVLQCRADGDYYTLQCFYSSPCFCVNSTTGEDIGDVCFSYFTTTPVSTSKWYEYSTTSTWNWYDDQP